MKVNSGKSAGSIPLLIGGRFDASDLVQVAAKNPQPVFEALGIDASRYSHKVQSCVAGRVAREALEHPPEDTRLVALLTAAVRESVRGADAAIVRDMLEKERQLEEAVSHTGGKGFAGKKR